jgi:zinc-binding alcohol dehydrogenase family protein
MRAIGYRHNLPLSDANALIPLELSRPHPTGHDLLVEVRAVSVNPVDVKVRANVAPAHGQERVLGFDAAGVVVATGPDVTLFHPGDAVFYAGDINRPGSNAEFQLVDERIVGRKPESLDFAAAAALPLTSLTAYEMLFDRLRIPAGGGEGRSLLILGGAGGVGSIAIQLARKLTGLKVIATASRPETTAWVQEMGAHAVIDHSGKLEDALASTGLAAPDYVFSTNGTAAHFPSIAALLAPQGHVGVIDDPDMIDVRLLKRKSAALHWEFMFTRAAFGTPDMARQHEILSELAVLVDAGTIRSTVTEVLGLIDAPTLRKAHALIESGKARGKIVLEGFV